ncbi:hypothetical protein [Candidatus Oleimmundimicrobium sp.]|uniref:hypothetical protein n=1 Tax=Candidatus Oleimmundimicrobium sp. TaxID=3060597 RepID=UPI00271B07B1|nr:hypothetical protein [Candidatus Oleimmundimicrobium sp.]MDO8885763.1 hypothetical protein [Candidatus Oleimmundimicrobium sp.]
MDADSKIAVLKQRADTIEKDHEDLAKSVNGSLENIWKAINSLRDQLLEYKLEADKKPTWAVTIIIGALLSMTTGLAIYIITLGR